MKVNVKVKIYLPIIQCFRGTEVIFSKMIELELTSDILSSIFHREMFPVDGEMYLFRGYDGESNTFTVAENMSETDLNREYVERLIAAGWKFNEELARRYHLEALLLPDQTSPESEAPNFPSNGPSENVKSPPYFDKKPVCPRCGHVGVRTGACFRCPSCGESINCS